MDRTHLERQWFISSKTTDIMAEYHLTNEIGAGAYGKVFLAQHIATRVYRAVKVILKTRIQDYKSFINELNILKRLDHPNIVNIIESFENPRVCFLVLEYCAGGELLTRVARSATFSEAKAANIMKQLFSALIYCHNNGIIHRDLKPDNFLFMSAEENSHLKIIDFGLSVVSTEEDILHGIAGTPYYIAPEILTQNYNQVVDCWSLGVVLYILLSGTPPFNGKDNNEVLMNIYNASFSFRPAAFKHVSNQAKDLICHLLTKDPSHRYTAQMAFSHPWIQGAVVSMQRELPVSILNGIEVFVQSTALKKASFMYIASKLTDAKIERLKSTFQALDINGDGVLSKEELCNAVEGENIPSEHLNQIVYVLDANGNGVIDYTEFLTGCLLRRSFSSSGYLESAFMFFDRDHSGLITADDIREALSGGDILPNVSMEHINAMILEMDKNNDGCIDYKEFIEEMSKRSLY